MPTVSDAIEKLNREIAVVKGELELLRIDKERDYIEDAERGVNPLSHDDADFYSTEMYVKEMIISALEKFKAEVLMEVDKFKKS